MLGERESGALSRREMLKRAAVGGALVWSAPVIDSVMSPAAAGTPGFFCGRAISYVSFSYMCAGDPKVYGAKIEPNGNSLSCSKIGDQSCEDQVAPKNTKPKPGHDFCDGAQAPPYDSNGDAQFFDIGECEGDGEATQLFVKLPAGCVFVEARVKCGSFPSSGPLFCIEPATGEWGYSDTYIGKNEFTFHSCPKP